MYVCPCSVPFTANSQGNAMNSRYHASSQKAEWGCSSQRVRLTQLNGRHGCPPARQIRWHNGHETAQQPIHADTSCSYRSRSQKQPRDARTAALATTGDNAWFSKHALQPWQLTVALCGVAMVLLNFHRSVFNGSMPLLVTQLQLSSSQVGVLQSAMLMGYLAGQLPAGALSDRLGGERVLLACILLWSVALAASSLTTSLAVLMACRALFGLFSAAAMPAISAMAAAWVPQQIRASTVAGIYTFFNLGGVLGLIVTPVLNMQLGWQGLLVGSGCLGLLWGLLGLSGLPDRAENSSITNIQHDGTKLISRTPKPDTVSAQGTQKNTHRPQDDKMALLRKRLAIPVLCWVHGVIGWGFFIMSSWIPLYLESLSAGGGANRTGLLASLPWLVAALVGGVVGTLADRLISNGWQKLQVRRIMHGVSSLGCAACVIPLCSTGPIEATTATFWLVAFNACYAFSFGGLHAYIQDVGGPGAGKLTGTTNSCSISMGVIGNLATGLLLEHTQSYTTVFAVTLVLYLLSFLAFFILDLQPLYQT